MRKLILIVTVALLVAPIAAHDVIWRENSDTTTPAEPMVLYYDSIQRGHQPISVRPEMNENCTVLVSAITVGSNVIGAAIIPSLVPGVGGNPASTVQIDVTAIRAPVNGSETTTVSASWAATGLNAAGQRSLLCTATGPHPFTVPVLVLSLPNATQKPNTNCTGDPISTATGEVIRSETDLSLGGPLPLGLTRDYGSMLNTAIGGSALGTNWMHNFDQAMLISGNTATVALYGGKTVKFQMTGGAWQLASSEMYNYQLISSGGNFRFLDLPGDLIYTFSGAGALTRIEDRSGNALTVTPGPSGPVSVSDGLGRTLTFAYNGARLASVTDQTGRRVLFTYTGGELTGVTDPLGRTTNYAYTFTRTRSSLMVSRTRPAGNKPVTHSFDTSGRAIREVDSLGNVMTVAYDTPSAGVTTATNPLAAMSRYTYQNSGNLTQVTDAAGQNTVLAYDTANRATSVTDRLGARSAITYHVPSGFVASITDGQGSITAFTYAAQTQGGFTYYNRTRASLADGTSSAFEYDAQGNVTRVTDHGGKVWTYTYNTRGQVLATTNPAGGVFTYAFNNDGTMASARTPAGDVTTYGYDNLKRPAMVQFPDRSSRSLSWDAADQLLSITDERGKVMRMAYDLNGNLRSASNALDQTTNLAHDSDDLLKSSTDPLGKTTTMEYDATGNPIAQTNAAGERTSYRYDALRRLISVADSAGKSLGFSYDAEGRVTGITDELGNRTAMTVDRVGRITRMIKPLGENFDVVHDSMGRITSTTNALGQRYNYNYDSRGLLTSLNLPEGIGAGYTWGALPVLTSVTDPNGNAWRMDYDNLGRNISWTDPLARTISYAHDARDRVNRITTQEGSMQITYDAAGNDTQRQYSDGTSVSLTYDDANRPTGGAGVALRYDAAGRIVNSNGLEIARDDVGRIAAITYALGKIVTYKYDQRGLLAQVSDWTGAVTTFTYDDARRPESMTRANGVVTRYTYDKNSRMTEIGEVSGDRSLASITLQYDADGKITSADRNVPEAPALSPGVLPLAYDAAHQVSGASYDRMGRITRDGPRNYTWNLASELTAYSGADGSASFEYDAFGLRTAAPAPDGAAQNYVLNYALVVPSIATTRSGGEDRRYYVHFPDGALLYAIEAADNAHRYYHFDETGSTTFLTDDAAAVTDSYAVTPYGETVTASGSTPNPFTWMGQWGVMREGSTGLYYMRFRYYDSATARFLSRDPVPQVEPRAINPYQYAAGNPMSNADPLGLKGGPISSRLAGLVLSLAAGARYFENSRKASSLAALAKAAAANAEWGEFAIRWFDQGMELANLRWLAGYPILPGGSVAESWWVRLLTRGKYLEMAEQRVLQAVNASNEAVAAAEQVAKHEATASRFARAAGPFKTVGNVLRAVGAAFVVVNTVLAAIEDYQNGAGIIITGTDLISTIGSGAAGFNPVIAGVDLLTGGAGTGFIHNALVTPNTAGVVIFSPRITSKDADAVKAIYTRFSLGRKVYEFGEFIDPDDIVDSVQIIGSTIAAPFKWVGSCFAGSSTGTK